MGSERRERESECAEASGVGVRKWGGVTHKSCFGAIFVPNFTTASMYRGGLYGALWVP